MAEWFENESFWIEMYPFMFSDERFHVADEESTSESWVRRS
jgi:hypothetical protein